MSVSAETVRIPRAVAAFVMVSGDRTHRFQQPQVAAQRVADDRVTLHGFELVGGETTRLEEDRVGHPDLPDVVEVSASMQCGDVLGRQRRDGSRMPRRTPPCADSGRPSCPSRASTISPRLRITESAESRSSVIPLQVHERSDARLELVQIDRLGQEVVGAGVDAVDAIAALGKRRDKHDRRQTGRRVALDAAAQLEAVHPGHHHVGDRQGPASALTTRSRPRGRRWPCGQSSPRGVEDESTARSCEVGLDVVRPATICGGRGARHHRRPNVSRRR